MTGKYMILSTSDRLSEPRKGQLNKHCKRIEAKLQFFSFISLILLYRIFNILVLYFLKECDEYE